MNLYEYITGSDELIADLKDLVNPVTSLVTAPIDALKEAASKWFADFNSLQQIPDSELNPELIAEKKRLLNSGQSIIDKIRVLGITGDTVSKQIGFVPIIAAGVIASSAGLMLYWTYDFIKFKDKMFEYKTLVQSGYSPNAAGNIVKNVTSSNSIFSNLEGAAKYGAIAIGGITLYYFLKKNRYI